MTDQAWKIATFIMGTILVPTFGWVWSTHTQMTSLRADFEHTKATVAKMEENTMEIKLIQRDLGHMNEKIDELMTLVVKLSNKD